MADDTPDFTETTISTKTVYQGRLLHALEDEVLTPDGKRVRREYVRHPGAVVMVPLVDTETVMLVRQFRYPLRRHFWELPAGKIEPGEEPLETGRRELREECGYEAAEWRHLATLHPCVGYSDERIELYLARGLRDVGRTPDESEFVEPMTLRLAEALEWVRTGRITDPKTMAGLCWAEKITQGAW